MNLHFESVGSGPVLIILHGLFGSLENWRSMTRRLGETFTVFAIDHRNHGRSPHAAEMSYGLMADDLSEFMGQQNLKSAHVLGHSMGGKTAMQFALRYPDLVDRLIIADMAPKAYRPTQKEMIDALLALDVSKFSTRKEIDLALRGPIPDVVVRQFLLKDLKKNSQGLFAWQMNLQAIADNYNSLTEGITADHSFAKPTLFLRGEKSRYIKADDEEVIHQLFPHAIIHTIEGAGHWLHVEAPEAFLRSVKDFLLPPKTSG